MKPKYTTEALRAEIKSAIPENLYLSDMVLDSLVKRYVAAEAALLDEVKSRISDIYAEDASDAFNQVTETLEAIRKELV